MALTIINKSASDNYSPTRFGEHLELIVLHTMDGYINGTAAWFNNPRSDVSAHYGVGLDGGVQRYVSEGDTAWHAGNWLVNTRSIGIEAEDQTNDQGVVRTPQQLETISQLVADICFRYSLPATRNTIKGHREVGPKPNCPGNLPVDAITARAAQILAERHRPVITPASAPVVTERIFATPQLISVTASALRVRRGPTTDAYMVPQPAPDGMLHEGQTFYAVGAVKGQMVGVTDWWLRSSRGNYVWAGGTNYPHTGAARA